ncbi:umecyanin-like [Telopea speciosissima]|uniref:umecyanin-like n=1 Tax=Telopea speciosissima TaxID=54955 RepID=UPI001CC4BC21|nr:umecyanin-like [Telopea speciosissima]
MDSRMGSLLGCLFIVAALLQGGAAQVTHVVGGNVGWTIPASGFSYDTWAANQTFRAGDTLIFNFQTGAHDVAVVSAADYTACTKGNPIGTILNTGPASIKINTTGNHYYICTFGQHCEAKQKLAITVGSSTGSPTSAPTPSTTPTTTGGTSPTSPSSSPSSASSVTVGAFSILLLSTVIAFFY